MARQPKTKAHRLLNELHNIPKIIHELKLDIERTQASLLPSPSWNAIKVSGGIHNTQDDKLTTIIDTTDYNKAEITSLLRRKEEILYFLQSSLDPEQYLLIFRAYCICEYPSDCIGKYYAQKRFYTIKKQAIDELNSLLERTDC